ncbi:uncharacterized protein C8Q71DRAFT_751202 [Rhodofomes roseus]|uniref:DUF410-domain-containing protein n=1 Tax=Rhodofomes roseus TaxID=34475 RepID=A0ABQ8KKE5_9APHY|nr:uncharacterized protein C8Q71DRAFT_751202 [Rhodofomes roseus]KAH9838439.1 hypothetical protein C8Q71DRAFT_751202 [Rhodofomes roseus]
MASMTSQPSSRALNAILPLITAGQAYEAHQKARTFASRYNKSGQFDTAIDVLFQSARELLKADQQGSGTDLASFMLDVYNSKGEVVNDESRGRITQLIALTGPSGTWRKTIIDKAVAWSAKHGPCPAGDASLHHYIGELLYKEGSFDLAEPHFLASGQRDSARLLAEMFVEWEAVGGTAGTFALRGAIPYLLNGNILAARTFIAHFVSQITSKRPELVSTLQSAPIPIGNSKEAQTDEIIFTTDSVLNFAQLAVRTCQRAQGAQNKAMREAWVRLCGTYQSKGGLMATKEIRKALIELAELYFSIPPPRTQAANPLGDMLSAMFGGAPSPAQPARRVLSPPPATKSLGLD